MASSILWIGLVVFILNLGLFIASMLTKDKWVEIPHTEITMAPVWYAILQPIIGGISLFLLSGTSILVIPLNKTLKREKARTFGTWIWGFFIWLFSVFYIGMFFFNIIAPVYNLIVATNLVEGLTKLDEEAIKICNLVMTCIPLITFLSGAILYGRVKKSYSKRHGQ